MEKKPRKPRSNGRGQLVKRGDGRYLLRVALGRHPDGRRKYHNETFYGTRQDAQAHLAKLVTQLTAGQLVQTTKKPLSELLRHWLLHVVSKTVRKRTAERYVWLAEKYLIPLLGHIPVHRLTYLEIDRAYTELSQRGLSPRTVEMTHNVLHRALEDAIEKGVLARNEAKRATLPKAVHSEMRAMTPDEVQRFMLAAKGSRFEALWALLLDGGLRPGEALALKWADFSGNEIHVQRSLAHLADGTPQFDSPKTAKSARRIPLNPETIALLRAHRLRQVEQQLKSPSWTELDLVFSADSGQPLEWRIVARRYWKPLIKEAGIEGMRPYDLRHTCASLLLLAGVHPKVVAERLGHSNINQTLTTYSHVLPTMQQDATPKLGEIMYGRRALAGH